MGAPLGRRLEHGAGQRSRAVDPASSASARRGAVQRGGQFAWTVDASAC